MTRWSLPSTTLLPLVPLVGAMCAPPFRSRSAARRYALSVTVVTLLLAAGVSLAWHWFGEGDVYDGFDPGAWWGAAPLFVVDGLNALLLPFAALIFAFVVLVQPHTEAIETSCRRVLLAEAVTIAAFLSTGPFALALLWCASAAGAWDELRRQGDRGRGAARVFSFYMLPAGLLLLIGAVLLHTDAEWVQSTACVLIVIAVMVRKGIAPLHSWLPESVARAPLPSSVLFNAPQIGAWVAIRLVAPRAPLWVLEALSLTSLFTAVYGAGLALTQTEARRAFAWLFLSQSALILVGLESPTSIARTGALSVWISSGLALSGLGMTIAALEARRGPLSLREFAGGYDRKPLLAVSFLVLGFASVGFPGTLGFVGQEALVHGVVADFPHVGFAVLLASMLNGITVLRTYFLLFCGRLDRGRESQVLRPRERLAFGGLSLLLIIGGLFPGPFVRGRSGAAQNIRRAVPTEHEKSRPALGIRSEELSSTPSRRSKAIRVPLRPPDNGHTA